MFNYSYMCRKYHVVKRTENKPLQESMASAFLGMQFDNSSHFKYKFQLQMNILLFMLIINFVDRAAVHALVYYKTIIVSIPLNLAFLVSGLLALNIVYAKNTSK